MTNFETITDNFIEKQKEINKDMIKQTDALLEIIRGMIKEIEDQENEEL